MLTKKSSDYDLATIYKAFIHSLSQLMSIESLESGFILGLRVHWQTRNTSKGGK